MKFNPDKPAENLIASRQSGYLAALDFYLNLSSD
jgi:hypothetical protein